MSTIFDKQNDNTALTYLKAYKYCSKQKKLVTYFMITISLMITLASIAVKSFQLGQIYSQITVLVSGVILVVNIFCSFWEFQLNIEAVNMLERYDVYVFNLPVNKAILRPIPEQSIVNYARKFKNVKKIKALRNFYFKNEEEANQKHVLFSKLKSDFAYDHRLLINVHSFFMFLWVGYIVLIMAVAISLSVVFNDTFIDTLVNIFVPALSTISLIASAWKGYYEQFRRLTNAVNVTGELEQSSKKDSSGLSSQLTLRQLQDAMHIHRLKSFTIPEFLIRRFDRRLEKEEELVKQELFLHETFSRTDRPQTKRRTSTTRVRPRPQPIEEAEPPKQQEPKQQEPKPAKQSATAKSTSRAKQPDKTTDKTTNTADKEPKSTAKSAAHSQAKQPAKTTDKEPKSADTAPKSTAKSTDKEPKSAQTQTKSARTSKPKTDQQDPKPTTKAKKN